MKKEDAEKYAAEIAELMPDWMKELFAIALYVRLRKYIIDNAAQPLHQGDGATEPAETTSA